MPNDTATIPEMQLVKQKYPVYKDVPDDALLSAISQKYPVYQKLADKYQGSITTDRSLQTGIKNVGNAINDTVSKALDFDPDMYKGSPYKNAAAAVIGGALNRPFGAMQAMTAGKSPIEGFQKPEEQPSFKESAGKAWHLDYNNPAEDLAGTVLDLGLQLGTMHLIMGVPIKAAAEGIHAWYNEPLHTMVKNEFKEAGFSDKDAHNAATHIVNNADQLGFKARSPEALKALKENLKGKLGTSIKEHVTAADTAAKTYGIEPKRLMSPQVQKLLTLKTAGEPVTDFGKQLKTDIENRPPFTPAEYMGGKKAVVPAVTPPIKPVVSTSETTPKLEPTQQTQPPTTIQPSVGKPAVQVGKPSAAVVSPSLKTTPSIQPGAQLRPAIKVKEGEIALAKPGEHHDDMVARRPELKNKQRGFVDAQGKFLNRTEAAKVVGQKEPLHSEDLPLTQPKTRLELLKQVGMKHASTKTMTFIDKGTSEKVQPLTPQTPLVNTLHNVHIETPTGDKMMTMNTKQLMDFKDNLKTENKMGIKIKAVQPLSSDDPKFKAYQDQIKKINDLRKKCQG